MYNNKTRNKKTSATRRFARLSSRLEGRGYKVRMSRGVNGTVGSVSKEDSRVAERKRRIVGETEISLSAA